MSDETAKIQVNFPKDFAKTLRKEAVDREVTVSDLILAKLGAPCAAPAEAPATTPAPAPSPAKKRGRSAATA